MRTPHAVLALAGLLAPLSAQGTYQTYGSGCTGSGCGSSNGQATASSGQAHNTNKFALRVEPSGTTRIILGFELLTRSDLGSLTIDTQIYGADPVTGGPTGMPLANGQMTLVNADAWYRTTFAAPLIIPAGQTIFLTYTPDTGMKFPFLPRGTGETASHFWQRPGQTDWNGTPPLGFETQPWAWRLVCAGGLPPSLSATGTPSINSSFTVDLRDAPPSTAGIFVFGVSDSTWAGLTLPLDLSPLNAPGCSILSSAEFQFLIQTDKVGTHQFRLTIPNDPTLSGYQFFNQYVVSDPTANGIGTTFSNGGKATIG